MSIYPDSMEVDAEIIASLRKEIERLVSAIKRIDAINDNPSCFNSEINEVCDPILRPHLSQQQRKET